MNRKVLNTKLAGNKENWLFMGKETWKQDHTGIIYPPAWSEFGLDKETDKIPSGYAFENRRENYIVLREAPLSDVDISVDYKGLHGIGGIIFRAVGSLEFYVVDIIDMGRKGQYYKIVLWMQERSGVRREIAAATIPHSIIPEEILQSGVANRTEWNISPEWMNIRIQATGTYFRVTADNKVLFDVRDSTYEAGYTGLVAQGTPYFRNFKVKGEQMNLAKEWSLYDRKTAPYIYLGGKQPYGSNTLSTVCRTEDGTILTAWNYSELGHGRGECSVMFTRSEDEGKTWTVPEKIYSKKGYSVGCSSLFAHKDGKVSVFVSESKQSGEDKESRTFIICSDDKGVTWRQKGDLIIPENIVNKDFVLYSHRKRLSDGMVIITGYEAKVPSGKQGTNANRLDRSVLLKSRDDGYTWEKPMYFDKNNFDHNECEVVEAAPGRLVAFMRTLRASNMWMSRSDDRGQTWTSLVQSDVTGECPYLLRHSNGILIMYLRIRGSDGGIFVRLSHDDGKTWSKTYRLTATWGNMIDMTEMEDGSIFLVGDEGWGIPSYARGIFFRIEGEGIDIVNKGVKNIKHNYKYT